MLQDWFATLYGVLHGAQGPLFVELIYPQSAAMLFAWTIIMVALFYYAIGTVSARFNMPRHWFVIMAVNSILCMLSVVAICRFAVESWEIGFPAVTLAMIQALYAAILFVVVSAVIKRGSPNARCTPW